MWVPPNFFESTHTFVGSRETSSDVVVVAKVVGNAGAKLFKCATEDNISISNIYFFGFRKGVVSGIFSCCSSLFRFPRFVGEGTEGLVEFRRVVCVLMGEQ